MFIANISSCGGGGGSAPIMANRSRSNQSAFDSRWALRRGEEVTVDEDGTDATIWANLTKEVLKAVPMTALLDAAREAANVSSAKLLGQLL